MGSIPSRALESLRKERIRNQLIATKAELIAFIEIK
jgi:hypothetical protein